MGTPSPEELRELLAGRRECLAAGPPPQSGPRALFPGAFAPLHHGHRRIRAVGEELLNVTVAYELSVRNVDKPPLDLDEVRRRAAQFGEDEPLWLTRAATFPEKSRLFPGVAFVVGVDTILRVADPRYYRGDAAARDHVLTELASRRHRFLVFGRQIEGRFCTLSDVNLPGSLLSLCQEVPAEVFRVDLSSTGLRRQGEW